MANLLENGAHIILDFTDLVSSTLPTLPAVMNSTTSSTPNLEWMRASDSCQLFCRVWQGKLGQPVILYLHGIEGHSQWFENTASFLNQRGMTIYAPDRRGAGRNARDRGHLPSYRVLLADLELLLKQISTQHPGHPIVVMANCWGAKPALAILRDDYRRVDGRKLKISVSGLVLISPAIFTQVDFDWRTKLKIALDVMRGDRFQLRELPIPIRTDMFTDNPEYIKFIEEDPLRLKSATARFYFESFLLSRRAISSARHLSVPLLTLQSGEDQIVNIARLAHWHQRVKTTNKSMHIFPDAAHSLDFDSKWFRDYTHVLSEWLLARTVTT